MAQTPLTLRRWKRVEYERLVDLGAFDREPIELIGGHLIVAEPKGSRHATAVDAADETLRAVLPPGWVVRNQNPVALDEESEPEPDLAVVPGARGDYRQQHPSRAALVVEVAESSLAFDRTQKGSLYARAGVAEYWIVNLMDDVLEVYRTPAPDPAAPYGWAYAEREALPQTATIAPLAIPSAPVRVARLFC
jgi:Uma2 family endonuclease